MKYIYLLFLSFFIYSESYALFIWNGAVDSDWNNTGNWSGNVVPSSLDDVTINSGSANYPVINSNITCNSLNVNSGASLTINSGTFNVLVLSDINGILTISGGAVYDADGNFDATGGVIDMSSTGNLTLASTVTSLGTLDNAEGTVTYDGGSAMISDTYYNLTINSGNTHAAGGTITVNGDLTVSSGTLGLGSNSATVSGNLDIDGTLTLSTSTFDANGAFDATNGNVTFSSAGNLYLGSTVTSLGTFTANNSTVIFDGSSSQAISSSHIFNNLTINNSSGITLAAPIDIFGTLTLTDGHIISDTTNKLTLKDGFSVAGGSATSHVIGPMDIETSSTSVYEVPIGDGVNYRPIYITPSATTFTVYTAEFYNTTYVSTVCGSFINHIGIESWWDINRNVGGADCYIGINWDANSGVNVPADIILCYYNTTTSEWDYLLNNPATLSNGSGSATATDGRITSNTPHSDFNGNNAVFNLGSGTCNNPLNSSNATIVVDFTQTAPTCFGFCDATVTAIPIGGTPIYMYAWDATTGSQNTATASGLCAGSYSVTVTDVNGCSTNSNVNITDPAPVSVYAGADMNVCPGEDVTLTASGATVYDWDNGIDNGVPFIQATGSVTYVVNGTDANGCSDLDTIIVNVLPDLEVDYQITEPLCDSTNGSIIATVLNPNSPNYYFHWSNGDDDFTVDSLGAGPVNLMISDDNQCHYYDVVLLGNSNGPIVNINNVLDETCTGANDGEIELIINSSNPPYAVSWLCGGNTEHITNLPAGLYQYTVTDQSDCISSGFAHVLSPDSLILNSINTVLPTCNLSDGSIDIGVTGGTGSPNYLWSSNVGFQSGNSVNGLAADVYSVVITDGNGCVIEENILLNNNSSMVVDLVSVVGPTCGNTGEINVNVSGGNTPYDFLWNNGTTNMNISGISSGNYILNITDLTGCESFLEQELLDNEPYNPGICMVTVDTLSESNVLVWEKPLVAGDISHYNIYRECCLDGVTNYLATIPYDSLSQFIDTICYPQSTNWGYQLGVVDTCGNISIKSTFHRSIHLSTTMLLNNTIDLYWNQYVGFPYSQHYIYRDHPTTGLVLIDSVDYFVTSYNDSAPILPVIDNSYLIEVISPATCTATKAVDHNTTRSNRKTVTGPGGGGGGQSIADNDIGNIKLYPNPTNSTLTVALQQIELPCTIILKDLQGRVVYSSVANSQKFELDLSAYERGIYLIGISNDNFTRELKVVKQ